MRRRRQRGATALEYAILASLIAAVIVVVVAALGGATAGLFQSFVDAFAAATGS